MAGVAARLLAATAANLAVTPPTRSTALAAMPFRASGRSNAPRALASAFSALYSRGYAVKRLIGATLAPALG